MTADYKQRVAHEVGQSTIALPDYARFSSVYFFLSLDLVNSTAYKADQADWKFRTRMFYDDARTFWTDHALKFVPRVWKYAGDEVLFYRRIRTIGELQDAVRASYQAVRSVSNTVQTWTKSARTRLYVKGTCWAAYASYTMPSSDKDLPRAEAGDTKHRNLIFQPVFEPAFGAEELGTPLDFLGPEIDTGFRIAAGSMKNSLVVSAEVANAIRTEGVRDHGNCLRIVDFREFKGVWSGRKYPLVWYRDDWSEDALDKDFEYDDRFGSELLTKAYASKPESADQLKKILIQVGRTWLFGALKADPGSYAAREEEVPDAATVRTPSLQVHCVAICFSGSSKVLIAKRKDSKTVHPGCWEAGCAQLQPGEDFYAAMKRDYYADFGVDLDFSRFSSEGPIGNYSFLKNGRVIPGVIFAADVHGEPVLSCSKHAEVKWAELEELAAFPDETTVPNLKLHVERAHRRVQAWAKS